MHHDEGIHPFAIEPAGDGLYYLHVQRSPFRSVAFVSSRLKEGFATEREAREFAAEYFQASDSDFAPSPMDH